MNDVVGSCIELYQGVYLLLLSEIVTLMFVLSTVAPLTRVQSNEEPPFEALSSLKNDRHKSIE